MNLAELPINQIEGSKIVRSDGATSQIFEYFPKDFRQMDSSNGSGYLESLKNFLLSVTNLNRSNDMKTSLFNRLKESKKKECLKFYKLDNQFFIESGKDFNFLESAPATNYYDYFLSGADDFYSDIVFGEDYFKINGVYFRLINCYEFPDTISPFALSNMADHVVSVSRLSQESAILSLKNNRKLHVGNMTKGIRDIESEKSYSESEFLLADILSGNEGLFEVEMWFILKADNESDLIFKTLALTSLLKASNVVPLIETKLSFGVIVPGVFFGIPTTFKRAHLLTASYASSLLPFDREFLFKEGLELRSRFGIPLFFDNFDPDAENFNVAITGPTGVGKTVYAL